jgi:uncharacterized protein involved in type VI secretion and phage assembly
MRPTTADGSTPGYFGLYPAFVTDLVDPDRLGRIEVRFPLLGDDGDRDVRAWATLCSPYADRDSGLEILPDVGSQVMVMFEAGNPRRPYVVGAVWNGRRSLPHPPESANNIRVLRSRAESRLEFDDTASGPKVTVSTRSGHTVVLDDAAQEITIDHATGCRIKLTATSVEINANVNLKVTAPMVEVNAPISTFNGLVKCSTLIAETSVVSPAYTPGAGNLW